MPASLRAHGSRAVSSSRPYDRPSPTTPVQDPETYTDTDVDMDVPPDHPDLPTYAEYKRIEAGYLHSLSPRKRDKALITQAMFDKIWDVLHQPEACTVETPQFRFWVRKMFTLSRPVRSSDGGGWSWGWGGGGGEEGGEGAPGMAVYLIPASDLDAEQADLDLERSMGIGVGRSSEGDDLGISAVVLHENRPVAIMEQLYELFCYCHVRAGHGGRDKTCAVIREHYSWVPKELTAQFVKACPTCVLKRSGQAHGAAVGVDLGVLSQRRTSSRGGKKGRMGTMTLEVGVGDMAVPVKPLGMGWPTTGGPLDPANSEPCGLREREQEWLRVYGGVSNVGPPSSVQSDVLTVPPRPLTLDAAASPFRSPVDRHPHPFAIHNGSPRRCSDLQENRSSPITKFGLPPLTSALSDGSFDENVNLTGLSGSGSRCGGGGRGAASECPLPPALRPLRLSAPVPCDAEPDAESDALARSSPYTFQIDPTLLAFDYPGLGLCESEPRAVRAGGGHRRGRGDLVPLGTASTGLARAVVDADDHDQIYYRPARPVHGSTIGPPGAILTSDVPAVGSAGAINTTPPFAHPAMTASMLARSRYGTTRLQYGELAMPYQSLLPDEEGRELELDGPLPCPIVADA